MASTRIELFDNRAAAVQKAADFGDRARLYDESFIELFVAKGAPRREIDLPGGKLYMVVISGVRPVRGDEPLPGEG